MIPSDAARKIKSLALQTGFDVVGLTRPSRLESGERAIRRWVGEGRHGSMKYLEDFQARRENFFSRIPDARSVIVLGVNYYTSRVPASQSSGLPDGRIARYAWGSDYHRAISRRHAELIRELEKIIPGLKAGSCVDIQPVPERFAAVQAGLGFVGKHTGLLNQRFGPWLFLSEIVTNQELEEDLPTPGDCGTCTDCQRVCPTGALDKDYTMDARLCIAYLTIEHKGVIDRELRPKIKDWIFGCDECLAVCPFGSKAKESAWPEMAPEAGPGGWLSVEELFKIKSNSEFEAKFSGTALARSSRKQMLRNACIVLGNSRKEEALPFLAKALEDPAPLVRQHAAWGLGQFAHVRARELLRSRLEGETDPEVRAELLLALKDNSAYSSCQGSH